ncbi:DUF4279 domain-containing protein [Morganella psychrotolerans]|uniref:DUF4279 domain-containing protein n=1 Tax=Morganella psychrotolerans TaxID=368603 RepID=UPI000A785D36|nr:DUF4279 domain-containing protein [Morganella psychrotolerans]
MNKTTVKAEFSIYGDDFNPDEITELLGISPMEVNLKGTINGTRKKTKYRNKLVNIYKERRIL